MSALERDKPEIAPVLAESLQRLESHLLADGYSGYDPYDALTSPLFRLPLLRSSKWLRIAAEQGLKRFPYNVRPLLGIRKGYNPVTLGFVLQACSYLAHVWPDRSDVYRARSIHLISELERLRSPGSGACWGYDFDWESRYGGRLRAGTPTVVATGLISNALFLAYRLLGLQEGAVLCASAARFVLNDLPRIGDRDGTFCWGYYPGDRQQVLNATMKGALLCAQAYAITGDETYLGPATATAEFVARAQRADGSWPYAVGDPRTWADNFHTAYVLDAFDGYEQHAQDTRFAKQKRAGWCYYRANFFHADETPKYYAHQLYPVDATSCAQSLLTLCRFRDVETAASVAAWTIRTMQCPDGHFAYQLRRRIRVTIPYMRWSSAYLYAGLSGLAYALERGDEGP